MVRLSSIIGSMNSGRGHLTAWVTVIFASLILLLSACNVSITLDGDDDREKGSGDLVTETREVGDFNSIEISNALRAEVTIGSPTEVEVEFDDNLLDSLRVRVSGETLHISCEGCDSSSDAIVRITTPALQRIVGSGASRIAANGLHVESLDVDLSGASQFEGAGDVDRLTVDASGASDIQAGDLLVKELDIDLSGASQAEVEVTNEVTGELSGASRLELTGNHNPTTTRVRISGASRLDQ